MCLWRLPWMKANATQLVTNIQGIIAEPSQPSVDIVIFGYKIKGSLKGSNIKLFLCETSCNFQEYYLAGKLFYE